MPGIVYYSIDEAEEMVQVERATQYYLDWAEEFRSIPHDWDVFTRYYRGLLDPTKVSQIRFKSLFFSMRLQPILTYVQEFTQVHGCPPHILDLGAGFGLESLLICLVGACVHGIDSSLSMVEHARKRVSRYQESHQLNLDLRYDCVNIFNFPQDKPYDAIYCSATLHHIEPVAQAIRIISDLLKPGGYFFLSDENGFSPVQQLVVQKRIGWMRPRKYIKSDPGTGERFVYGNENIRSLYGWKHLVERTDMQPEAVKYCRFLPPVDWPVERLVRFERKVRNIPMLTQLWAIGFTLLSRKKESAEHSA